VRKKGGEREGEGERKIEGTRGERWEGGRGKCNKVPLGHYGRQ
jgi:hypothetical protein